MKNPTLVRTFLSGALLAIAAACGGTPNTPTGSVVGTPASSPPSTALVNAKLQVVVPMTAARPEKKRGHFLSSKMQSLAITLASVDGNSVSGAGTTIVNTGAGVPDCSGRAPFVCTSTVSAGVGLDDFNVTTYSAPGATGDVLSVGTITQHVASKNSTVTVDDATTTGVKAIVNRLTLAVSPSSLPRGKSATSTIALSAFDAAGGAITSGEYNAPVTLSIQGDVQNAFLIHGAGGPATSVTLTNASQRVTLAYDGNAQASSITLQAGVDGYSSIVANANVTLQGTPPPPPAGEIFVLNAVSTTGFGANVTVYDGKASGNAAPKRTLTLDPTLYARSIAVDPSGNLYVGYMDSATGAQVNNSFPDTGNEIAVYAPGASGSAAPKAILKADGSNVSIFPSSLSFDPKGNLVTYGNAILNSQASNAVIAYAPASSGSAVPVYSWAFNSPLFKYPGPTGLTLDATGNFYALGVFYSNPGDNAVPGVYTNLAADESNSQSNPARIIPVAPSTSLFQNQVGNESLDASGEIYVANFTVKNYVCQGQVNVFASGATGGTTSSPPLRVLVLSGVSTNNTQCSSSRNKLNGYYPYAFVFGNSAYVTDQFNNTVSAFPTLAGGTVKASQTIAGSATGLNNPIGVVVTQSTSAKERTR